MRPQARSDCPICGVSRTNHNMARHIASHRERRVRLMVPPETQELMCRLYRSGKSYQTIARETTWGSSTVRRVLLANGVTLMHRRGRKPFLPVDEALRRAELYGRGYSIQEVADLRGVSYAAVRNTLIRNGVEIRRPGVNLRWARSRVKEAA